MIIKGRKIGSNDPCPCGSGKKFKKCCIDKGEMRLPPKKSSSTKHPLSKFNREFLLRNFASMQLLPTNHGKNIRLELLIKEAFLHGMITGGSQSIGDLKKVLDIKYNNHYLEDSPTNIFTENITFYGGDYLIMPGILDGTTFILSTLIASLIHTDNDIPSHVKRYSANVAMLLFRISDMALKRAGLRSYQNGQFNDNLLDTDNISSEWCFFSHADIADIVKTTKVDSSIISNFITNDNEDLSNSDPDKNPFIPKPFISTHDGYILVAPGNVVIAVLHSILSFANYNNCLQPLLELYSGVVWNNINFHLQTLSISSESHLLPKIETNSCKHSLYRIDTDKLIYCVFDYDSGHNYDPTHPFESRNFEFVSKVKDNLIRTSLDSIKISCDGDRILLLIITAGIGREYARGINRLNDILILGFSASDFEIFMKSRDYDGLDIWNYVLAKNRFTEKTELPPLVDELDIYALYKEYDNSFYLSDDAPPNGMMIQPGLSNSMIHQLYIKEDIHSIFKRRGNRLVSIPCLRIGAYGPICTPMSEIGVNLVQVVEGYYQPIWIEFFGDIKKIKSGRRKAYIEFLEAISYWIWQVTESTKEHLKNWGTDPFLIQFDFIDRSRFEEIEFDFERKPNLEDQFITECTDYSILVKIPVEINPYLFGADNLGERELVKSILNGMGNVQLIRGMEQTLNDVSIEMILEKHAPLGNKKKIFLLNTQNDLRLDPRGIPKVRYVQDFNIDEILDDILLACTKKGIITSDVGKIENGHAFVRKLVKDVLVEWLNEEIKKYNSDILLEILIRQNESLVNKRAVALIQTPTRIACFVEEAQQVNEIGQSFQKIDKASLSIRCLIEHVAACPGAGEERISQSGIDRMVALMEQIISWGLLGDQIKYNLFDVELEVLASGRIGSKKDHESEVFDPFRMAKAQESVTHAIQDFEQNFKMPETNIIPEGPAFEENVDNAFYDEYGVSLTRIIEFSHALVFTAFENDPGCTMLSAENVYEQTKKFLPNITKEEVAILLDYYCLKPRKTLMDLPEGYLPYDVYPWRYNRGLSLLRKPIVQVWVKGQDAPLYYWGPRQIETSSKHLIYLFYSGKLRTRTGGRLSKLIGKILDAKGSKFTLETADLIGQFEGVIVDKEVDINTKSELRADTNLGDVDVLVISEHKKVIFLIECKKLESAKIVKQMVEEAANLLGSESRKGWMEKHQARFEWAKRNIKQIEKKYKVDLTDYKIIPLILTSEELITKYLKRSELPFEMVSYHDLDKNGVDALMPK